MLLVLIVRFIGSENVVVVFMLLLLLVVLELVNVEMIFVGDICWILLLNYFVIYSVLDGESVMFDGLLKVVSVVVLLLLFVVVVLVSVVIMLVGVILWIMLLL